MPAPPAGAPVWHALIAAANPDVTADVAYTLARLGMAVSTARTGDELARAVAQQRPHLVVASYLLPGLSGRALVHELRTSPHTRDAGRLLVVEPDDVPPDRLAALRDAVDAVVRYPDGLAALSDLTARVAAVVTTRWVSTPTQWVLGPVVGDDEAVTVHVRGVRIDLTNRERAVLRTLAARPAGVADAELYAAVWGAPRRPRSRGLIVEISRLRVKLIPFGVTVERTAEGGYAVRWSEPPVRTP